MKVLCLTQECQWIYNIPSIEPSFVLKELKKMSEHKATGPGGITSKSLKAGAPAICGIL